MKKPPKTTDSTRTLPYLEESQYITPILQCLYVFKAFREDIQSVTQEPPKFLSIFSEIFDHLDYGDGFLDFDCSLKSPKIITMTDSLQIFISACNIEKEKLANMLPCELQEHILLQTKSSLQEINRAHWASWLQFYNSIEKCLTCTKFKSVPKELEENITNIKIKEGKEIEECLQEHFNQEIPDERELSEMCSCENSKYQSIREYRPNISMRILNLNNPERQRSPMPTTITVSGSEFELQAFITKTESGVVFTIVKHSDKWYLVKDEIYEILDIDHFLKKGEEIILCYYGYSSKSQKSKGRRRFQAKRAKKD